MDSPVEITVGSLGGGGDGLAEHLSERLYVPFTVPGDRVLARPGPARGDGFAAELIEVLSPGPGRAAPPCPHFGRCGGCALQHLADDAYVGFKLERLARALARAGFSDIPVEPLQRTPPAARRRASLKAIRSGREAVARVGFAERRSHAIVDIAVCHVLAPAITGLLPTLRRLLGELLPPGVRTQIAVALLEGGLDVVLDWPREPGLGMRERLATFAEAADLGRLSWRRSAESPAEPVAQRRPVGATFGGVFVAVPPGGFLQASAEGEAALAGAVREAVGPAGRIADLFAGAGTFTLPLAGGGAAVHAVDADASALRALAQAARAMPGVGTEVRDLFARPLSPAELRRFDAVVLDPPRAGARAQAEALARSQVPVVVAVSCNPDTFARDARVLADGGYRLARVWPVDQFLWSPHLELAALFRR